MDTDICIGEIRKYNNNCSTLLVDGCIMQKCSGLSIPVKEYKQLYMLIGLTYGIPRLYNYFKIPDLICKYQLRNIDNQLNYYIRIK